MIPIIQAVLKAKEAVKRVKFGRGTDHYCTSANLSDWMIAKHAWDNQKLDLLNLILELSEHEILWKLETMATIESERLGVKTGRKISTPSTDRIREILGISEYDMRIALAQTE